MEIAFITVNKNYSYYDYSDEIKRLKRIYQNMKSRCYNKKCRAYKYYGSRGIKICNEWLGEDGFVSFALWAITNGYDNKLQIDRINNNGNYEPQNCRWVDSYIQNNNTRKNHFVIYQGNKMTISQLARIKNIHKSVLRNRIVRGWDIEKAVNNL